LLGGADCPSADGTERRFETKRKNAKPIEY